MNSPSDVYFSSFTTPTLIIKQFSTRERTNREQSREDNKQFEHCFEVVCVIEKDFRPALFNGAPACIIHFAQTGSSELVVLNLATIIGPAGNSIQQHRYWLTLNIHQERGHCIWETFLYVKITSG